MHQRSEQVAEDAVESSGARTHRFELDFERGVSVSSDIMVETSQGRIAVRQSAGTGLPVLFLHGLSDSKDSFAAQFDSALGQIYRLIAVDLPGHGASDKASDPQHGYSIPGYADVAVEVLESLGLEQAALVGSALGGHIAIEMMACFPGVVGTLISGTLPAGPDRRALIGPDCDAPSRVDREAVELTTASVSAGDYADTRDLLEGLETPVAIVNGADDPLVSIDDLSVVRYGNLWGGVCQLIPGAGHRAFIESPQLFNPLLAHFLLDMTDRARDLADNPSLVYSA